MNASTVIMLIAGIGIPVLAAMNAGLGRFIGSPAIAASVLFLVALSAALITSALTGLTPVTRLASAPKYMFLAGLLIAFYLISITYIAPKIGVGNAVFFVLLGQLISAAAIDHFGLFGAVPTALTTTRAAGIAIMAVGVFVTQKV